MSNLVITKNNVSGSVKSQQTALEKLRNSLAPHASLKDKVLQVREEQEHPALLVLDVSGSMAEHCEPGRRKIDALREIVSSLKLKGLIFKQMVFSDHPVVTDQIPNPGGNTALHLALDEAARLTPRKVVLVTDGIPDSESLALEAARRIRCQIDVFYVGPPNPNAEEFLRKLASGTGGQYDQTDLSQRVQIASQIAGLLTR